MGVFWDFVFREVRVPARPGFYHGYGMAEIRHYCFIDRRILNGVEWNHLELQVEREGSMD